MKVFITKDTTIDLQVSQVVKFLNSKCKFVRFEEQLVSFQAPGELIKHPYTHKEYLKHIKPELINDDFIILATELQYDNNYFYDEEEGLIILSFFGWKYLTSLSIENGLVYMICGMLINEIVPWDAIDHSERLGCVNDFLSDKTRVDDGMRKGHLCNDCKEYMQKSKLSTTQVKLYEDIEIMLRELSVASAEERKIFSEKAPIPANPFSYSFAENINPETTNRNNGTSIFISYSHEDEEYKMKLEKHLAILRRLNMISIWTDRKITAGDEWKNQINENLKSSYIILMLISSNFIASDYCYEIEMTTALEKHNNNEAIVIPVILRECFWQIGPFAELQALPQDGKPIQKFTIEDEAYTAIAREICRIIKR